MNNLNSLILEGVVIGEPHKSEASDVLNFTVGSERYYKNRAGEYVTETSQFKVVAFGDSEEKYFEDIDKAVALMGNFTFPN